MTKSYRHGQILQLVRGRSVYTQDELARALKDAGIDATQVTLSRDIRELGLVKTPNGYRELAPGAHLRSDAELLDYVRNNVATLYHPVGTCAMGSEARWGSVLDPELKVRGIDGLRVVDASVMPTVPRGNTNAPTIAIAERAADLIAGRAPLAPWFPENSV